MTSSMVATPANAAGAPSWMERRTRTQVSSSGPTHRNTQNGMASSKRRTSLDTRFTICRQQEVPHGGAHQHAEGCTVGRASIVVWRQIANSLQQEISGSQGTPDNLS